jgi:hypothetical protein
VPAGAAAEDPATANPRRAAGLNSPSPSTSLPQGNGATPDGDGNGPVVYLDHKGGR